MRLQPGLLSIVLLFLLFAHLDFRMARADEPAANRSETSVDESKPLPVPEPTPLAVEFHRTGNYIWLFARFWDCAVPFVLVFSGASAKLSAFAKRLGNVWFFHVGIFVVLYIAIVFVVGLPLHYYAGYVRQHAYGLSNQTFFKWLGDSLKSEAVDMVGAFCFVWVPILLIDRRPKSWWLITAGLMIPFIYFVMLISPILIDPLFNDFGPMKNQELEAKILALADRAGIEGGRVFEVNKSVDTKAVNAYVKGFLSSKRIVLWDTLLNKLDDREVLVVMGHEMGHYVLNHVAWSIALSSLILIGGLFFVDRMGRWVIQRYSGRIGFESLGNVAAIPLLIVLMQVSSLVLGPIALAYSRHNEAEADRFALELTRANRSGAEAFADLQRENLGIPYASWLSTTWRGTHPSLGNRIEFCNDYHPWTEGKPLQYSDYIKPAETDVVSEIKSKP